MGLCDLAVVGVLDSHAIEHLSVQEFSIVEIKSRDKERVRAHWLRDLVACSQAKPILGLCVIACGVD